MTEISLLATSYTETPSKAAYVIVDTGSRLIEALGLWILWYLFYFFLNITYRKSKNYVVFKHTHTRRLERESKYLEKSGQMQFSYRKVKMLKKFELENMNNSNFFSSKISPRLRKIILMSF